MNANDTDERRLREELRWAREALAIAEMQEHSMSFHGIAEAHKECIETPYSHMVEWSTGDLEDHLERTEPQSKRQLGSGTAYFIII